MQKEIQDSNRRKEAERSIGNGMNTTAAIYLRKSTEDDGKSVAQQEKEVRVRAEQLGLDIVATYREDDGTSASHITNNARPQMVRCFEDFKAGKFSTLIVWALDRWSRKGASEIGPLLDTLETRNGRLVDCSGIDTGAVGIKDSRIPLLMSGEMAWAEIDRLAARINRGKEQQRKQGAFLGGQVPFGLAAIRSFDAPTYLVIDPAAAEWIRKVADWVIKGSTINESCAKLNEQGVRTATGSHWHNTTLRRLMRSPHLIGQRRYRDTRNGTEDVARDEDGNPMIVSDPILDDATFRRVDEVLKSRRRSNRKTRKGNGGGPSFSLLSGLLHCSKCAATMIHDRRAVGIYYRCPICRPGNSLSAPLIEAYISNQVLQIVEAQEDDSPIAAEIGKRWSEQYAASDVAHRNELQDQAGDIEARLAKLRKDHYVQGAISDDDFEEMEADLLVKMAPIEATLALMPEVTHGTGFLVDLIQLGGDLADPLGEDAGWSKLDHHIKRSIIRCVIDRVTVEAGVPQKPGENTEGRCNIVVVEPEEAAEKASRGKVLMRSGLNRKAKLANA